MAEMPPQEPQYLSYAAPELRPHKGLAIASMSCGIAAIVLLVCAWYIAIPSAIVAVVLGFVARSKARRGQAEGRGMALTGIICGISALMLAAVLIGALVLMFKRLIPALAAVTRPSPVLVTPTTLRAAGPTTN